MSHYSDMFEHMLNSQSRWLMPGPDLDIVISSRVRLARNLRHAVFPHYAGRDMMIDVRRQVFDAALNMDVFKNNWAIALEDVSDLDKQFLIERHLISYEHTNDGDGRGVIISSDEGVSIMVNEEDHIRLQVMLGGFDMENAWLEANALDDAFSQSLDFAFTPDVGFHTACPTNVGTGLRGSVMVHLPALVITKQINKVLQTISKLNFIARGLYGEGTQAMGNFFQISNQASLGYSEEELIDSIKRVIKQVVEQERMARERVLKTGRMMLEDRVLRAYAVAQNARIVSSKEALELLSLVRLGVDLGIITDIDNALINDLFIITQPAHLQKISRRKISSRQRDIKRAKIMREKFSGEKEDNETKS